MSILDTRNRVHKELSMLNETLPVDEEDRILRTITILTKTQLRVLESYFFFATENGPPKTDIDWAKIGDIAGIKSKNIKFKANAARNRFTRAKKNLETCFNTIVLASALGVCNPQIDLQLAMDRLLKEIPSFGNKLLGFIDKK